MKPTCVERPPSSNYKLASAALVYSNGGDSFITLHDVTTRDGKASIGAGVPATRSRLRRLVETLAPQTAMKGWVDARLLYIAADILVWWRPAGVATMHFARHGKYRARSGQAMQPPLVFAVSDRGWAVWAVSTTERPTPNTPLAHAPYFNVYEEGGICTGDVKLPRDIGPDTIRQFEDAFFDSRFTHPNHDDITKSAPFEVWASQLDQHPRPFPADELVAIKHTLGDVVGRMTKGQI